MIGIKPALSAIINASQRNEKVRFGVRCGVRYLRFLTNEMGGKFLNENL